MMEFKPFTKIPRLSRNIKISEKIDGTNASVFITNFKDNPEYWIESYPDENGIQKFVFQPSIINFIENKCIAQQGDLYMFAGSRKRWITPEKDNYGFAKWVQANSDELFQLGEGQHFGEWWGKGIQRNYGMEEKVFSLFNVGRWADRNVVPELKEEDKREHCPKCCRVVPILYEGMFDTNSINNVLDKLKRDGSIAAPKFMNPEGIIIFHTASRHMFKKTVENDDKPKGSKE